MRPDLDTPDLDTRVRPEPESAGAGAMSARAAIRCENTPHAPNRLTRLRSEGLFVLRPTHPKGPEPYAHGDRTFGRVSISAGTAGPLGGDRLSLDVHVGAGAQLVLNDVSATLALPGTRGDRSELTFTVQVDDGATLIWMPEPVIAARGCEHRQRIRVRLAPTARFHLREELIVGRHGERPGNIEQHLRVTRGGRALFDQNLRLGDRYPGWDSPAVAGNGRAVGTLLVVDPESGIGTDRADLIDRDTVSTGIDEDSVQAEAVADDSLTLSRALDRALDLIGPPWSLRR